MAITIPSITLPNDIVLTNCHLQLTNFQYRPSGEIDIDLSLFVSASSVGNNKPRVYNYQMALNPGDPGYAAVATAIGNFVNNRISNRFPGSTIVADVAPGSLIPQG